MDFENKESKMLFLTYAIPCAGVLVKRGTVKQEEIDNLLDAVVNDKKIPEGAEKVFGFALKMCENTAKKLGKPKIDNEVIREYFWVVHDRIAKMRYKEMHDFKLDECIVYPGEVLTNGNKKALVRTPIKMRYYKNDFVPDLKREDNVTVHYDYVVEKISEQDAKKLWELKGKK